MGEIGVSRWQYLYILDWLDLVLIERGYDRRSHHLWSAVRWSTFYTLSGFIGSEKLKESGISSPSDLLMLPWEHKEKVTPAEVSPEEEKRLLRLIQHENEHGTDK